MLKQLHDVVNADFNIGWHAAALWLQAMRNIFAKLGIQNNISGGEQCQIHYSWPQLHLFLSRPPVLDAQPGAIAL